MIGCGWPGKTPAKESKQNGYGWHTENWPQQDPFERVVLGW